MSASGWGCFPGILGGTLSLENRWVQDGIFGVRTSWVVHGQEMGRLLAFQVKMGKRFPSAFVLSLCTVPFPLKELCFLCHLCPGRTTAGGGGLEGDLSLAGLSQAVPWRADPGQIRRSSWLSFFLHVLSFSLESCQLLELGCAMISGL